jgi:hypothetical protein
MKLATPAVATSGTAIDFTGLPAGITQLTMSLVGVSHNGTSGFRFQLGTSGGLVTTGYVSQSGFFTDSDQGAGVPITIGAALTSFFSEAGLVNATFQMTLVNSSTGLWLISALGAVNDTTEYITLGSTYITLSGVLDRVRLTSTSADTFDAGVVNIAYF